MSIKLTTLYRVEERTPSNIWQQFIITTDLIIAETQAKQLAEMKNRATRIVELKQQVIKEFPHESYVSSRHIRPNERTPPTSDGMGSGV